MYLHQMLHMYVQHKSISSVFDIKQVEDSALLEHCWRLFMTHAAPFDHILPEGTHFLPTEEIEQSTP